MAPAVSLNHRHASALYDNTGAELTADLYPMLALDSVGMPPAGADFIAHAVALGDDPTVVNIKNKKKLPVGEKLAHLYRAALYDPTFALPITVKTGTEVVQFMPGHLIREMSVPVNDRTFGPKPARIMIVGKMPGDKDIEHAHALASPSSALLGKFLRRCGFSGLSSWYVTFACKFASPVKDLTSTPAAWLKNCAPLLEQEIRLVQPDFILCLGAEATKAVLKTKDKVSEFIGRVVPITAYGADGQQREIKVFPVTHPAFALKKPELDEDLIAQLQRFRDVVSGKETADEVVDHADIYTEEALRETVDDM